MRHEKRAKGKERAKKRESHLALVQSMNKVSEVFPGDEFGSG